MSSKNIELNEDQQLAILTEWNSRPDDPPYISQLIELVFPDVPEKQRDGRSKYGRAVKKFLAEKSLPVRYPLTLRTESEINLPRHSNPQGGAENSVLIRNVSDSEKSTGVTCIVPVDESQRSSAIIKCNPVPDDETRYQTRRG